jgi:sarcosine oxidase
VPRPLDVIVVGLGAMGSATLRALARRGMRVLGLDRHVPPHEHGSSHGGSRIIREAYFEDPRYVPLVQRAYLLWEELARESDRTLLTTTGGLMLGPRDGVLVEGALASARAHHLAHELLDAEALRRRYPQFNVQDDTVGVWEPRAGVLRPEQAVAAFLESAARSGASVKTGETVTSWRAHANGVSVTTTRGTHHAAQLVLSAGARLGALVPELPLTVERLVQMWFEPVGLRTGFEPDIFPIWIWEFERGHYVYGFPRGENGVKVARHHEGEITDADHIRRDVAPEEIEAMRAVLKRTIPFANGPLNATSVCMYTNLPDENFLVDRHPSHANVMVVSACSGHGFKFAPAIGEAVSDLIVEGWTRHDLGLFAWRTESAAPAKA